MKGTNLRFPSSQYNVPLLERKKLIGQILLKVCESYVIRINILNIVRTLVGMQRKADNNNLKEKEIAVFKVKCIYKHTL